MGTAHPSGGTLSERDEGFMRRALELAERGHGRVSPNPLVGAVVVSDGEIVGEGWHAGPGTPHAEVHALRAAGDRSRGGTLYVNLEPCSHQGRTPPCAPAVAEAGIRRVVVAVADPNPVVDGRGLEFLRAADIEVVTGVLAPEASEVNRAFLHHVRTGLPYVTLKMAASLDGKVAARDGSSRWISGEASRARVHRMRAGADAVMVGAGTAAQDDPSLTVRHPGYRGPPKLRVLVDGRGRVPRTAALFDGAAPTLVATTDAADAAVREAWGRRAEVVVLPDAGAGRVPLDGLMKELSARGMGSVLLEGGPTLAADAVARGLVRRLVLFIAPILVGGAGAPSVLMGEGADGIGETWGAEILSVEREGDDIVVTADVHGPR